MAKGERLNQNLFITKGIALKDKSKVKVEELKILKRKIQGLEDKNGEENETVDIMLVMINKYSCRFICLQHKPYRTL